MFRPIHVTIIRKYTQRLHLIKNTNTVHGKGKNIHPRTHYHVFVRSKQSCIKYVIYNSYKGLD